MHSALPECIARVPVVVVLSAFARMCELQRAPCLRKDWNGRRSIGWEGEFCMIGAGKPFGHSHSIYSMHLRNCANVVACANESRWIVSTASKRDNPFFHVHIKRCLLAFLGCTDSSSSCCCLQMLCYYQVDVVALAGNRTPAYMIRFVPMIPKHGVVL